MTTGALLPALALATAFTAAGCGDERAAVAPNTIVMNEYEFVPTSLSIESGAILAARNEGAIAHNLVIEKLQDPLERPRKLIGTDTFLGGGQRKLKIDLRPGRYTMICSVPGHRQLGMYGTITVR